nr:receptor-type tyrosine-protein phosphatase kappa-like [Crassostrea gigas]
MPDLTNIYQNVERENHDSFSSSRKASSRCVSKLEKTTVQSMEIKNDDIDIDEKIHEENPYGDFYVNDETLSDIAVSNFEKIIEEKSKNDDDGFKKEYATLAYGERYPCVIGKLPENLTKNRFKTTFPYDHSRVQLKKKQSDYVNANYIDGLKEDNVYIATQGPKQNTVADFWCMVWQEHIEQIIMLTNVMEGNTAKCFQYWPALETSMDCDNFTLITTDERHYAYYVIRKLKMIHKKDNKCRTVNQYHYTSWPDHGIPEPLCLLLFNNHVTRTKNATKKIPVLVHCSAGIGRTGTYIAIDALYEECKQKKRINIAEYVEKMREKRMNMVQTYEQYKAIFLTFHEAIKAPVAVYDTTEFLSKLKTTHKDKPTNVSLLRKDFKRLVSICPTYTEKDYKMAAQHKDISSTIKPHDKYVLFLTSYVPKRGTYINAISLPSFTNPTAFIVTHYQTTDNAVDFLRLITDHDSKVVVSMEPLSSVESENKWMPCITSRFETISPFTIQLQQERITEIKCCQVKITKKANGDQTWSADLIEPIFSLDPGDPRAISQIVGLVSFVQNTETEGPIIVISRDGAALCGVFCAVFNLIQQMTMDEEIDVFSVVRLLQTRRPEQCSTMEEYILIHDVLMEILRSGTEGHVYYNQ